jgi:cyclophilin family peptidyl-prolyl cis-trans isomerase
MKKIIATLFCLSITTFLFAGKQKNKFVVVETTLGTFKLELFAHVPQHSRNFLKLVKEGFYDSLLFHRVIPSFMIQGGDPDSKLAIPEKILGDGDLSYKLPAEFMLPNYFHKKGALCAARDDNPEMASSACQFYVVVGKLFTDEDLDKVEKKNNTKLSETSRAYYKSIGGTPHLDGKYTVFGQCVKGQDIVDKISNVLRNKEDRPNIDVRILKMKIKRR